MQGFKKRSFDVHIVARSSCVLQQHKKLQSSTSDTQRKSTLRFPWNTLLRLFVVLDICNYFCLSDLDIVNI